jgi:Malectin domain
VEAKRLPVNMQPQNIHDADDVPRCFLPELTQREKPEHSALSYWPKRCDQGMRRINVQTSVDVSQRRMPHFGIILSVVVVVLFCRKSHTVESVRMNSVIQSLVGSSDRGGEQFDVPNRRKLQSSPVPAPTGDLWSLHINAGTAEDYTDTSGTTWISDSLFVRKGQRYAPTNCAASLASTADSTIYCTQLSFSSAQSNPPFVYRIPVPKDSLYEIRLHFAEIVSF